MDYDKYMVILKKYTKKKYFAVTILGGHMMTFINVLIYVLYMD